MKLATYLHAGRQSFGLVTSDGLVDLSVRLPGVDSIRSLLERQALADAGAFVNAAADHHLAEVTLLPPLPDAGKILCAGVNYEDHRKEGDQPKAPYPTFFMRFNDSHVGHGQALERPSVSEQFDYEGELAVVIGSTAEGVSREEALSHVVGYSLYNDGSVRDWQTHTSQWGPGKNFDRSGAFGPYLWTVDEVPDITASRLITRLNGEVLQQAVVRDMTFDIATLVSYASTFTTLRPGDVIVTGTPAGVGIARNPQVFMRPGDVIEIEVTGLGVLSNPVVESSRAAQEPSWL
ncbi:fumarylacetoacetate hydrolase family protein [Nonomuraea sp. NPDC050783]|uniref:fumarylacetoacetate hydrolase family protein n=1 Tax=Nonomuraea sp. NPDC050783 TaxID=3154634 RepID=UPI003464FF34